MTKINIKKSKTTAAIISALIIGLLTFSPLATLADVSVQIPANAIRTADGGWITPIQTVDDKGNPLTIHYEVSQQVFGKVPPTCTGPFSGVVEQEGGIWSYPTQNSNAMGFKTTWTMPTGSVTNTANGLYYNPVNFYYTGTTTGNTHPYTFFQVDWGIGGSTVPGGGLLQNWSYTMGYLSGSTMVLQQYAMPSVTTTQGSTYTVMSDLQPSPMASNQYVVQVTLGSNSWIYSTALTYTPQLGHLGQSGLQSPMSFQDEYETTHGTTTLSSDTVTSPTIVLDNSNTIGYDTTSITGVSGYTGSGTYSSGSTCQILSSTVNTTTKTVTDSTGCPSW